MEVTYRRLRGESNQEIVFVSCLSCVRACMRAVSVCLLRRSSSKGASCCLCQFLFRFGVLSNVPWEI